MTSARARTLALGLAVGLVLADSSIVILALPEVLDRFGVGVDTVAWVLTAFNLVLALAALPAAYLARRVEPALVCGVSLVVFAAASAVCALAQSIDVLIAARAIQAIGGAGAVCAALELLPSELGSERAAASMWAAAGGLGAAAGPALGGVLTQLISWRAIFAVQAPLALLALAGVRRRGRAAAGPPAGRPHLAANLALGLVSAALTAALFLVVLMLIDAWGLSPFAAALTVSVMPLSAVAAAPLMRRAPDPRTEAAAGAVLMAGGLAALGLVPGASAWWTVAPLALIGAGLAATLLALTGVALHGRDSQAIHGGWTIAARHAGVVLGLLVLTAAFTADLSHQQAAAERTGAALVLDSRLSLQHKLALGQALLQRLGQGSQNRLPNLAPAFAQQRRAGGDAGELDRLQTAIEEQARRAATHAFSRSFLLAAAAALLAVLPIARGRTAL